MVGDALDVAALDDVAFLGGVRHIMLATSAADMSSTPKESFLDAMSSTPNESSAAFACCSPAPLYTGDAASMSVIFKFGVPASAKT